MRTSIAAVVVIGFVALGLVGGGKAVAAEADSSTIYIWRYKAAVIPPASTDQTTDYDSGEQTEAQPWPSDDGDAKTSSMGD